MRFFIKILIADKALLVPDSGNSFQSVQFVAAVIHSRVFNCCYSVMIIDLLRLQLIMIFPTSEELLQSVAVPGSNP
jgi:hypothetical protein